MYMEKLHQTLSHHVHCNRNIDSECWCKEIMAEEVSFFLQSYLVGDEFLAVLSNYVPPVCDTKSDHLPLKCDDPVLRLLFMFFKFCIDLDEDFENFMNSYGSADLMSEPQIKLFLQNLVLSTFFSPDVQLKLQYVIQAYLNLELEASETARPEQNVFESFITYRMDATKLELLHTGRLLNDGNRYVRLEYFIQSTYISFILSALSCRVRNLSSDNYTDHLLDPVLNYTQSVVRKHWMKSLFSDPNKLKDAQAQLKDEHIYKLFYDVRKPDIFSIIIEFPDSMDALLDLSKCFHHVPIRLDLIAHLKEEVKRRLLHPGVHTEQILVAYSYLVRALRIIDKSFLAQDIVCRPVSLCLRQREDAVRCIVDKLICAPEQTKSASKHPREDFDDDETATTSVFGGPSTELHSELLLPKPLEVEQADAEDSDADVVAEDPPFDHDVPLLHSLGVVPTETGIKPGQSLPHWGSDWQPDPVEAMYQSGHWRRRLDLLSMLVSIYGSKKAFLVEYRQLLSQRLLRQRSFQTALELHNLELLKLRFGEQNLYECEVMLKDIRDSKRIAALMAEANTACVKTVPNTAESDAVAQPPNKGSANQSQQAEILQDPAHPDNQQLATRVTDIFPLSVFVLSAHYWPEILDDHFKIPDELCTAFRNYEQLFQRFKANRTLQWMHKLGLVNIDLILGDKTMQLDATPLQVSIVHLFNRQSTWNVRDLAQELQTSTSNIRQGLQLFLQLGFIRQGSYDSNACQAEVYSVSPVASGQQTATDTGATTTTVPTDPWMVISQQDHPAEDGGDAMLSSVRNRKEKELHVFWTYIVAMLTNLGSLSLDRIHSMLRMFALNSTSSLECNREELRQFLDTKIRAGQIAFDGEAYRIVKPD